MTAANHNAASMPDDNRLGNNHAEDARQSHARQADGQPLAEVGPSKPAHAAQGTTGDQSRQGPRAAEGATEYALSEDARREVPATVAQADDGLLDDLNIALEERLDEGLAAIDAGIERLQATNAALIKALESILADQDCLHQDKCPHWIAWHNTARAALAKADAQ